MVKRTTSRSRGGKSSASNSRSANRNGDEASAASTRSSRSQKRTVAPAAVEDTSPKRLKTVDATHWKKPPSTKQLEETQISSPPKVVLTKKHDPFLQSFFNAEDSPAQQEDSPSPSISEKLDHMPQDASLDDETNPVSHDMSSEDEEEWEQVGPPPIVQQEGAAQDAEKSDEAQADDGGFEIAIRRREEKADTGSEKKKAKKPSVKGVRKEERLLRMLTHKVHLLCLLSCGLLRNQWCNDEQLQSAAVAAIPDDIFAGITGSSRNIGKGKKPATSSNNVGRHQKFLLQYLKTFARWWKTYFRADAVVGLHKLDGTDKLLVDFGLYMSTSAEDPAHQITAEASALMFTAACRGLKLESRLVCSLHPIPLSLATQNTTTKSSRRPARGSNGIGEGTASSSSLASSLAASVPNLQDALPSVPPLNCWCEVYSPVDKEWIPVDPVRGLVNDTVAMEPPASAPRQAQLSYVIAFEPGFGIKDVTKRYTSQWGAKTVKLRIAPGSVDDTWWEQSLWLYSKSTEDEIDKREAEQLKKVMINEKMPTSLAGFKDHHLYALERQLKKFEVIYPSGTEHSVGRFKNELVYPRRLVKELHTPETWLKKGRRVCPGEEPVKHVKARVATINRKRQIEAEKMDETRGREDYGDAGDSSLSAVFGEWQTEVYVADPIIDGKIPRNDFGNFEVFHPNMIPAGAVHLPYQGMAKVAKTLGIEYVSVVTGFDFQGGHSKPVILGVLVETHFQDVLLAAYEEYTQIAREKALRKRQKRIHGRWRKLTMGLITKDRVMREYLPHGADQEPEPQFVKLIGLAAAAPPESSDDENTYSGMDVDSQPTAPLQPRRFFSDDEDDDDDSDSSSSGVEELAAPSAKSMIDQQPSGGGFMLSDDEESVTIGGGGFLVDDEDSDS
ncbi:hypothetical protein DFS34DRAFT_45149 [Phlyctochytrium arcticum]|nr:hypothetical protein DFS34DRAFT_45149 [Phlyctochytrium arcticum]